MVGGCLRTFWGASHISSKQDEACEYSVNANGVLPLGEALWVRYAVYHRHSTLQLHESFPLYRGSPGPCKYCWTTVSSVHLLWGTICTICVAAAVEYLINTSPPVFYIALFLWHFVSVQISCVATICLFVPLFWLFNKLFCVLFGSLYCVLKRLLTACQAALIFVPNICLTYF